MKPRLISFIAAEGFAIDQVTSRVTAFNMVDHVAVAGLPSLLMRLVSVSFYELADETDAFHERVRLIAPNGEVVSVSENQLQMGARVPEQLPSCHRSFHVIWRTPIKSTGDYKLVLERRDEGAADWRSLGSLTLPVVVQLHAIMNSQAPVSIPSIPAAAAAPGATDPGHRT